ncbi:hypothetical protein DFJ74DRAFT_704541 [Hyaloraphidium curvatum]|nr:hypothetical protein DFJ74DRAFT_714766 [Hyaloraphidium curvatum]KAI9026035.1 hypothetical protein DFJ74DRAFT_704541 [Hyaloraphidium curvatum]
MDPPYDSDAEADLHSRTPLRTPLSVCESAVRHADEAYPDHLTLLELKTLLESDAAFPPLGVPDTLPALWKLLLNNRTPGTLRMWSFPGSGQGEQRRLVGSGETEVPEEHQGRRGFVDYGTDGVEPVNDMYR